MINPQKTKKGNKTLKEIIDLISYKNPSTQDEIAESLGITRRYVTKLIQPLIKEGIIKRSYVVDLEKLEENPNFILGDEFIDKKSTEQLLIKKWISEMTSHIKNQLNNAMIAVIENDSFKAEEVLERDNITNNRFDRIRTSIQTIMEYDLKDNYLTAKLIDEISYNLERIGNHCNSAVKITLENYSAKKKMKELLKEMFEINCKMIDYGSNIFIKEDPSYKTKVLELEEELNLLQKKCFEELDKEYMEKKENINLDTKYFRYLSLTIRSLERIGDLAVEIGLVANELCYIDESTN